MSKELRTGSNPANLLGNLSQEQRNEIAERHAKTEEQAWAYLASYIRPIDEETLKRFARKYATDSYTDEQFLDSMIANAEETGNLRLIEGINYVVENFCLNPGVNLGMVFAKRPDVFSGDFVEAAVKSEDGNLRKHLLNYAQS
jgi:hypothetical protein